MTWRTTILLVILLLVAVAAMAQDDRRCYQDRSQIPRTADGSIKRSTAARAEFVRNWPCPATGQVTGTCAGWQVDHIIPLACGGCDAKPNMQWLPTAIKTCAGAACKDRWELKVYCR